MKQNAASAILDKHPDQSNLSYRTLSALLWTFSGVSLQFVLRMLVLIILARLLTPADFGVFAATLAVIQFSEIFALLGVGPALVQRPHLEERHVHTGFTFSMFFAIVVAGLIWLLAPAIANFFQTDKLIPILRVMVLVFPLTGLGMVAESLMQRELQFRKLAGIEVASYAVGSGIVGVSLAFAGLGLWALVAAHLVQQILRAMAMLVTQPHSKKLRFEFRAFKELFYFGGGLTVASVFNYFATQADNLVVGRWLGMNALGLYGRAYNLMVIPVSVLGLVSGRVLFPAMSSVQNDVERLKTAYRRGSALIALIMLPLSVVLSVLAPELIDVVLGPAWTEAVTPFRIIALGMAFRAGYIISAALARAKGAIYRNAWRHGAYAALIVAGAWIGQHWGLSGVAVGVLIALAIHFLVMAQLGLSITQFAWRGLWSTHLPGIRCAAIIGTEVWGVATVLRGFNLPPIVILLLCAVVVLVTILVLIRFVPMYVLGTDGMWLLRVLLKRLPAKLFFPAWLQEGIGQPAGSDLAGVQKDQETTLVSILINNYNYAQFLRDAIDSALSQTHPHTEVIVVDDGSTDNSREIIASYGDRIIPVLKENGGQGSAFNAGFAASKGDVICFLDADDVFLPEKVALVLKAWKENPNSCLVYHQLQPVDAQKAKVAKPWPPSVWSGDIKNRVERSGGWWPRITTSGLCCSRSYLERIFPMPTEPYKLCADAYVAGLAPFLGPVTGVNLPLALYRVHGQNRFHRPLGQKRIERARAQRKLNRFVVEFEVLKETLHKQMNLPAPISLEDHFPYQQYRRATGEAVSILKVISTAIRSPALPRSMKVREVGRIILNRY